MTKYLQILAFRKHKDRIYRELNKLISEGCCGSAEEIFKYIENIYFLKVPITTKKLYKIGFNYGH